MLGAVLGPEAANMSRTQPVPQGAQRPQETETTMETTTADPAALAHPSPRYRGIPRGEVQGCENLVSLGLHRFIQEEETRCLTCLTPPHLKPCS